MSDTLYPPYAAVPLPKYMRNEIERRSDKYGNNYTSDFSKIKDYKGAMTPWIRAVSNSKVNQYSGFVLYGGDSFKDKYGIQNSFDSSLNGQNVKNATIIGYDRKGKPHYIENNITNEYQKHRPIPGIISIDVDIQREIFRKATIKWKCFTVSQINYMTPYFFSPYNTVLLEWGWNTYNPESLIDITEIGTPLKRDDSGNITQKGSGTLGAYTNAGLIEENLKKSEGKYDALVGHIVNFDYSFDSSDMSFNCTTELYSNSKFYYGLSVKDASPEGQEKTGADNKPKQTIYERMKSDIFSYLKGLTKRLYEHYNSPKPNSQFPMNADDADYSKIFSKAVQWSQKKSVVNAGGLFSLENYTNIITEESATKFRGDESFYISLGLLADILNIELPSTKPAIKLDLNSSIIGAHPNLISTTSNFLIPNENAPSFTSENLNGQADLNEFIPPASFKKPENRLMIKALKTANRQNLDEVINWLRYKMFPGQKGRYSFPYTGGESEKFKGNLKDVYIKYVRVLELLDKNRSIKEFAQSLCQDLNSFAKIWDLKLCEQEPLLLSIRDERFLNLEHIKELRTSLGLTDTDPTIYPFDVYSQNSILKSFNFNVKLSDKVANMVLYDAESQSAPVTDLPKTSSAADSDISTGQSYIGKFQMGVDEMLSAAKENQPVNLGSSTKSDPTTSTTSKTQKYNNIDEDSMMISSPPLGFKPTTFRSRTVEVKEKSEEKVRLKLPKTAESFLVQLISDNQSPLFANISTMPMPGVTIDFTILGISGFRSFQIFTAKNLPKPYDTGVIFQVREVKHSINRDGWITSVTATVRPSSAIAGIL